MAEPYVRTAGRRRRLGSARRGWNMRVGGKEPRHKRRVKAARHVLYGLLLWLCHEDVAAADHLTNQTNPRRPLSIKVTIQSLGADVAGAAELYRIGAGGDDAGASFGGIIHAL